MFKRSENYRTLLKDYSAQFLPSQQLKEQLYQLVDLAGRTCYNSFQTYQSDKSLSFIKNLIDRGHESVLEHATISQFITADRGLTHELVRHRIGVAYSQMSTRFCITNQKDVTIIPKLELPKLFNFSNNHEAFEVLELLKGKFGFEFEIDCSRIKWFHPSFEYVLGEDEYDIEFLKAFIVGNPEEAVKNTMCFICPTSLRRSKERINDFLLQVSSIQKFYMENLDAGMQPEVARSILPNSLLSNIVVTANVREWRHIFKERLVNRRAHPDMRVLMSTVFFNLLFAFPRFFMDILLKVDDLLDLWQSNAYLLELFQIGE